MRKLAWGLLLLIGWAVIVTSLTLAYMSKGQGEPTDTQVEFYYVPDPSEWHNEDSHPICCANETERCRKCVTL